MDAQIGSHMASYADQPGHFYHHDNLSINFPRAASRAGKKNRNTKPRIDTPAANIVKSTSFVFASARGVFYSIAASLTHTKPLHLQTSPVWSHPPRRCTLSSQHIGLPRWMAQPRSGCQSNDLPRRSLCRPGFRRLGILIVLRIGTRAHF